MKKIIIIAISLAASFGTIYSQNADTNGMLTNAVETVKAPIAAPVPALSYGQLIGAEFAGLLLPGTGAAHFIMGDTQNGFLTLGATACSLLIYTGAELLLQNGAIDSPWIYNPLHYGSMLLFASAYLFDLIGSYSYFSDVNSGLKVSSKVSMTDYRFNKNDINLNVIALSLNY